ncbi:MAG TPA: sortase [Methylomirabilota bacterium]|nr:sortase [Methylomirabilota bacterium]
MTGITRALRDRFVPAVLTAAGVTLLAAGLLHYGSPAQAGPVAVGPTVSPSGSQGFIVPSLPPFETSVPGSPVPTASPDPNRLATRVVVEQLGIDLPVIAQPNPAYPSCNVAMYFEHPDLGQPGQGKATYLYAHARAGMFLPLLTQSKRNAGKGMIGMIVSVYTSDDQRYVYTISAVLPRVPADEHFLDKAIAAKQETLWLQTSTGPGGQFPKLQVVAKAVGVEPADHADAHPKARPVNC